jgi:hypothetical protein
MNQVADEIAIPTCFLLSNDWISLSDKARINFIKRIEFTVESINSVSTAVEADSKIDKTIDDIELEALISLSIPTDSKDELTAYIIHSSLTFECDEARMASFINTEAMEIFNIPISDAASSELSVKKWLKKWANAAQITIKRFSNSEIFTEAVTQLIILDALLSTALTMAAIFRLKNRVRGDIYKSNITD